MKIGQFAIVRGLTALANKVVKVASKVKAVVAPSSRKVTPRCKPKPSGIRAATASYRKQLRSMARKGEVTLSYVANKAAGFPVYAKRGTSLFLLKSGFTSTTECVAWCQHKCKQTPERKTTVKKAA